MKAVIMAGGKGTRLRPLTCNMPKPMVPVLSKPVMEYTIMLLRKHQITEIAVTVQYLPEEIKNYFGSGKLWGVKLHYFEETHPLGTAGSVKNCEKFLDQPFVVISGDGITDIDLTKAINFHRANKALATIVLTKVDNPLEFGVVIVDIDGKIVRFLEKPGWSQVFSDLVNTGIYILNPQILKLCPENTFFDFSKDLFPLLQEKSLPLYGCALTGYWSDIGNIHQYCQTQFDILAQKTTIPVMARELRPNVWIQEGVQLDPNTKIIPPVFIGTNTVIERDAMIGAYSVIGKNNIIRRGATFKKVVCLNNGYFNYDSELRGCVIGNKVKVGVKAKVFEGATVGDNCVIEDKCIICPEVKLWPHKQVEEGVKVTQSLIWGERQNRFLFGLNGIAGLMGVDLTPGQVVKIAGAYASTLPNKASVAIGANTNRFALILKDAIRSSLLACGVNVLDGGIVSLPVLRNTVRDYSCQGGIFVGVKSEENGLIVMLDSAGLNIPVALERKIENSLAAEDFPLVTVHQTGELVYCQDATDSYFNSLLKQLNLAVIKEKRYKLAVLNSEEYLGFILQKLAQELNIHLTVLPIAQKDLYHSRLKNQKQDLGAVINPTGDQIKVYCEHGELIPQVKMDALQAKLALWKKTEKKMHVSVAASSLVEEVGEELGVQVGRTQVHPHQLMNLNNQEWLAINYDGISFILKTLEYMSITKQSVGEIISSLPDMYQSQREVPCPWQLKGLVMRRLMEEKKRSPVEMVDGLKFRHSDGWTLILPDAERPIITVTTEANSKDLVDRHLHYYENKILEIFQ